MAILRVSEENISKKKVTSVYTSIASCDLVTLAFLLKHARVAHLISKPVAELDHFMAHHLCGIM